MTAVPNPTVPLFEATGEATGLLRDFLASKGEVPRVPLIDVDGLMQPIFRHYLAGRVTQPLPSPSQPIADENGRPTRAMTLLLMGFAK